MKSGRQLASEVKPYTLILKKGLRELFFPLRYEAPDDITSQRLGDYYLIFDEDTLLRGRSHDFHFDDAGIPMIRIYVGMKLETLYNPVAIGQYALAIFNTFLRTRAEKDKSRFLLLNDWFVEHGKVVQPEQIIWEVPVAVPRYGLAPHFVSAMAQARAISVLVRAYQLTGDEAYSETARKALGPFQDDIGHGGVKSDIDGNIFFEEAASNPPSHILNGFIFTLFGLYDYVRVFGRDGLAFSLFQQGAGTLEHVLPKYDMGFWSRYDLYRADEPSWKPNPATRNYHDIHIKQLQVMYRIVGSPVFAAYAQKWRRYERSFMRMMRMYWAKLAFLRTVRA